MVDAIPSLDEPPICAQARALVGCTYPSQDFLDAIAPGETPQRQLEMGKLSCCALLWRAQNGGTAPYVDGEAFADVWKLAGGSPWAPGGRVRIPRPGELPALGEAVVYDKAGAFPQHIDFCWLGSGYAVAGGQRNGAGQETIAIVSRPLTWEGGRLVDIHTGRAVMAIIAAPACDE